MLFLKNFIVELWIRVAQSVYLYFCCYSELKVDFFLHIFTLIAGTKSPVHFQSLDFEHLKMGSNCLTGWFKIS